jgi:PPOX class probable F420-dependent enzyme
MPASDARPKPRRRRPGILRTMNAEAALEPAARIDRMLRREPVVWVSTVRPDGSPHLVPIWFSWDGERVFIASKPNAVKVRNLRANPKVFLALGEPDEDFDVGMLEGVATISDRTTAELLPAGHLAKYRRQMAEIGLDADEYIRTYSQPVLITPTRYLPWHGRTTPRSATPGWPTRARDFVAQWGRSLRPFPAGAVI